MSRTNLQLVDECDRFPYYQDNPAAYTEHLKNYHFFKVSGCDAILGYIVNDVVSRISWAPSHWTIDSLNRTVTLTTGPDATPQQRSAIVAQTLAHEVQLGTFDILKGWRDELYPVYGPNGEFLLELERSATPLFGIVSYGIHSTCYVEDENGLRIWVPRRSRTKQTYPGMLDNSVAGGMSTTEHPFECLVREAMEEASLPEEIVRANATPAGCVSYIYVRDSQAGGETDLVQPEVEYVFDIKVGADVIPKPCDSEVEEFMLYTVEETKAALANGEFKPNCSVVLLDFFIRHGILTAENEPDYLDILTRVHRRLEFPTASHVTK
ncbi:thiamine pyrophosphokinase-related protein [Aspergillus ellipticus CBS 707.79]|uniref:Thiamine pyrophosphokinase-related protein n=1 Tax=Aspergillus ellipticus CBS 707.79 TaxID=1448320 RepID=A0A319CYC4_9EURO|nr:thiamine pyrophosphokinase-related protein [Aspergillus ellipticus CBS 707.79]